MDEERPIIQFLNQQKNGIEDCIEADIIEYTKGLDIFMLNNEFFYSDRGKAMDRKAYTFRAKPKRIEILKILGTAIVLPVNNHVCDYGKDAGQGFRMMRKKRKEIIDFMENISFGVEIDEDGNVTEETE